MKKVEPGRSRACNASQAEPQCASLDGCVLAGWTGLEPATSDVTGKRNDSWLNHLRRFANELPDILRHATT